jgi:hypothetical protein
MNFILQIKRQISSVRFRQLTVVLLLSALMGLTTACTPDTTARQPAGQSDVPTATEADVNRAKSHLSSDAVDEDVLSQQGVSRARQSDGTAPES